MMMMMKLLLLFVAVVCGEDRGSRIEEAIDAKAQEVRRIFSGVEQQLSAAEQVVDLFVLEDAQLQMATLETRAKLHAIQEEVDSEMKEAMKEVEDMRQAAVESASVWRKTLQGLEDVTQRNQQTLQRIREEKEKVRQMEGGIKMQETQVSEAVKELEMLQEMERQRELEKEPEVNVEEKIRQLHELERRQKLDERNEMEIEQEMKKLQEFRQQVELNEQDLSRELEKPEIEKLREQKKVLEASSSEVKEKNTDVDKDVEHKSAVKRLLAWYMFAEETVVEAAAKICRQLVLPVVVIIGFFIVLTVIIARYNARKQALRNRRVLYSGYPKSYRPKPKHELKPILTDATNLRPRLQTSILHNGSNDLTES